MITIQQCVQEALEQRPDLKIILSSDFINLSALARELKPKIEERLLKPVKLISITLALKRLKKNLRDKDYKIYQTPPPIRIKEDFCEVVFATKDKQIIFEKIKEYTKKTEDIIFTKTENEITIILPKTFLNLLEKLPVKPKKIINDLTIITINLTEKSFEIPGIFYKFFQSFYADKIAIIEIFSSYTEFSLVVKTRDLFPALTALKRGINLLKK